jgi:hypothetical protein
LVPHKPQFFSVHFGLCFTNLRNPGGFTPTLQFPLVALAVGARDVTFSETLSFCKLRGAFIFRNLDRDFGSG